LIAAANLWLLWIPLGLFGAARIFGDHESTKKFRDRVANADTQWTKALADWERRCGAQEVLAAKKGLSEAKTQLQNLPTEERNRLANYEANRRDFQLKAFLANHRIRSAKIRGIGPAKEASLASYGIDTAADISHSAIVRVPGFGDASARPLLEWRRRIEARFVFSPQPNAADVRERDRIVREIAAKRDTLRSKLRSGPQMLRSASQTVMARWKSSDPLLARAYAEKEQAQVDWNYVTSNSLSGIVHIPTGIWVGALLLFLLVLGIANMGSLAPRPTPLASPTLTPTGPEVVAFAEQKQFVVSPKAGVAAVNMRSGPGGEFATVSQVPAGEVVIGTGQSTVSDGTVWIAVTRSDGSKGYIAARLLKEAPAAAPTPTCDSSAPWADYTVCSDEDAKALDQKLRSAVAQLRKALSESDRATFDEDQTRWLQNRQNCTSSLDSRSCLTTMYRDRIGEIDQWPKSEAPAPVPTPETEVEDSVEPSLPTIAVPARLRNSDNLITNDDYPARALRDREQGVVTARFQVDDTGRVSGCTVIVSSGSRLLDDQTCNLITRRFRYEPARSAAGIPLFSTATKTVRWTLP
jgi:TonB family protein